MSPIDEFQHNGSNHETTSTPRKGRGTPSTDESEDFKYRRRHEPPMRLGIGVVDSNYLVRAVLSRLLAQARGPTQPLAIAIVEQLPELMTLGMPPEASLREALQTAIHAARLKSRHCVGDERLVFDDFIALCLEMESIFRHLAPV